MDQYLRFRWPTAPRVDRLHRRVRARGRVYIINASFPDPSTGILQVGDDLAAVVAALQQAL